MMSKRSDFSAQVDDKILLVVFTQHAHHLVKRITLGNPAEVDGHFRVGLAKGRIRSQNLGVLGNLRCRHWTEAPASYMRSDGDVECSLAGAPNRQCRPNDRRNFAVDRLPVLASPLVECCDGAVAAP